MRIQFFVKFHTGFGQTLHLSGNIPELGSTRLQEAIPLHYFNEEYWQVEIEADLLPGTTIGYRYLLTYADGYQVVEWGNDRELTIPDSGITEIQLVDTWNHTGEFENVFYSQPFLQTLLSAHTAPSKHKSSKTVTHIFKVKAPLLKKHEVLCLCGKAVVLGDWITESAVLMTRNGNWWEARVNIPREELPLQYKYGVYQAKEKRFLRYEEGNNRLLFGDADNNKHTILHDGFVHLPNNTWKGAGVAISVFSLRSETGFGVGEFTDLKLLADWAKKTGLKMIQILPVNDTTATHTWVDSYPYAAISAFAMHPIYLNLEKVAGKKLAELIMPLKKKQAELNALPELDYEQVMQYKLAALKELYTAQKDTFLADEDFLHFFEENKHWLVPYAAFCYLRDKNGTSDFSKWKIYSSYDKAAIEKYVSPKARHYDQVALQYFIQYHLHLQLKEATEYAHKNGIIVKGDIPIGIYRHSCDAWVAPELYNMNQQAGAPPDGFAIKGQNWGFPTYNWKKMEADGYAWWKQRFDEMSNYFDAFRIDHILGFFRIWSIPLDAVEGVMGRFVPALPVHINEFHERNIWFDYNRYTRPFIADHVVYEIFSDLGELVKDTFLNQAGQGQYTLKPEFDNQRKVEKYFCGLENNNHNNRLKYGVYDLISNVILFEQEGAAGTRFHFRIAMENTSSFRNLEAGTREQLKDLYVNYFFRRQDDFWMREAMHKLPALKASTNMLICGEDLGMVPRSVPDVMKQLGILSLEIQRMPKDPKKIFFHPNDAPYLSVVTPSTHDMSTIRGWWEEDRTKTRQFFNSELGQWGEAPFFCDAWINRAIVVQHLYSPAMWSIFQLQDILGMSDTLRRENPHEERINVPAIPQYYWRYRMHIPLEQLVKEKAFNHELKGYVEASGRT
jgi:4-alpha-glucanotransferase